MRKLILLIGLSAIIIGLQACDSTGPDISKIVFPEKKVSYMNHVEPFMKYNCSYLGCHGINSPGEELSDYNYLLAANSYVFPGNPDASLVIQILERRLPHPANYPIYFANITENQIHGMRVWIAEGAMNN
jgi:hypothetical protein